ncbi:hypothetical protein V2J09_007212 [Rumex salicifolius]
MRIQLKTIVEEIKGIRQRSYRKLMNKSFIAPELGCLSSSSFEDGDGDGDESAWTHLPPELLLDIIKRVEATQTSWPGRRDVVACAAVCRSWRDLVGEVVKTPQECGLLTFPISLKQPGPKEHPIQCFIRRERSSSTYLLYLGLCPALCEETKLLLAAKKIRKATCLDFVISLVADDFSRASLNYVGKLRSNFLGTKFTIYDSQPAWDATTQSKRRVHRRLHSRQVSPSFFTNCYPVASIYYELNVLRTRGPRKMNCTMDSIPTSSIEEYGTAPTPMAFIDESSSSPSMASSLGKSPYIDYYTNKGLLSEDLFINGVTKEPLMLKNKAPRWHEQLQCWCLNFKGRVTVASVKNFQLVASVDLQEKVVLQFGKIGKDVFTMDYRYPLSAFQAFAICLSSFDTKPACFPQIISSELSFSAGFPQIVVTSSELRFTAGFPQIVVINDVDSSLFMINLKFFMSRGSLLRALFLDHTTMRFLLYEFNNL